jgi:hypothetical protein
LPQLLFGATRPETPKRNASYRCLHAPTNRRPPPHAKRNYLQATDSRTDFEQNPMQEHTAWSSRLHEIARTPSKSNEATSPG